MSEKEEVIEKGRNITVVAALIGNQECPLFDFLEELSANEVEKAMKLFYRVSNYHPVVNTEKYKKVQGDLYELKPDNSQRIFCFQRGKKLVLANGYKKKTDKLDMNEVEKAERIKKIYDGR
jgi:hypothetical protein